MSPLAVPGRTWVKTLFTSKCSSWSAAVCPPFLICQFANESALISQRVLGHHAALSTT